MSVENKYTLRLHYNNFDESDTYYPNLHNSNNGSLYYKVAEKGSQQPYSLIALYDDSFAGRYVPNSGTNTNVSLYGSLTSNGCYSFTKQGISGSTFKFFSIHPEKYIHSGNGMEDVKFLCNEVNSASTDELFLVGLSDGLALIKKSGQPNDLVDFVINRKLVYDYDTGSLSGSILMQDQRESVIIPTSDIDPELGKEIKVGRIYKIKAATTNDPVKIYDARNDDPVGTLKSGTILVTKDHPHGPELVFAHGAGKIDHHDPIGALQLDTITLYRDENSGEFRYYFSDRKGKETSNPDLVDYCNDPDNCKMKDLNLFPNVRAYIKSTLTSADIADFSSQGNVNAASVALILKQTVINDVAQELVTNKADYLGTALFHTSSGALGGTITDYINQKMPGEIAKDVGIQQAVITALKSDPGMKGPAGQQGIQGDRGPDGRPGNNGQDADPAQVAEELVKQSDTLVNAIFQTSTNALSGKTLEDYVEQVMPKQIAQEPVIQRAVAIELRNNPGRARGPDGPTGPRGPEGQQGIQGDRGPDGRPGNNGQDADPAQVAEELVTNKADELGKAIFQTSSVTLGNKTITDYVNKDMPEKIAIELRSNPGRARGPEGPAGQNGQDGRDADPAEVTHRLAHNTRFKRSLKGDDGVDGERGEAGVPGLPGPEGKRGTIGQRGPVGPEGKQGQMGQQGPQGEPGQGGTSLDIAHRLAHNSRFKRSLRGDDGTDGERGEAGTPGLPGPTGQPGPEGKQGPIGPAGQNGQDGRDADPVEVTHRLAHNARFKRSLKGDDGEKGDQGLKGDTGSEGPRGDRGERGEVGPTGPQGRDGKQGEKGDQGEPGKDSVDSFPLGSGLKSSIKELQKKPQLKIVSGEPYNENIQKANIELEGVGVIATFLEIGYFFKNDNLYIRDHITGNNILIPKNFHFLTVVAEDGFENYKLAFCNNLGNLFFDYQKYGSEYAGVLEEYKTVDLRYIKNAANIDLSKYYYHHIHTPLFAVRKGELEGQSLENYRVDVYEMAKNKKIGTLVDEFGFFERDQFHYVNHHQGYELHFQELNVGIENHEGNFQIDDNIVHPITLRDGHLNLLDYLGYS